MHLLNRSILYEELQERDISVLHRRKGLENDYLGYRYLTAETPEDPDILYICPFEEHLTAKKSAAVYCGPWAEEELPPDTDYYLCPDLSERALINLLEDIFGKYRRIEEQIRLAQTSAHPLFEICEAAADYFHAPCYFHDEHFFLRAYDRRINIDDNPAFVYSGQYKAYMQAQSILDEFKINPAFQRTFGKQGVQFWVDPFTENRCIYVNQYYMNRYLGRFIIELEVFTPGLSHAAEFFSSAMNSAISRELLSGTAGSDPIASLLKNFTDNERITREMTAESALLAGWPSRGRFACAMIRFYQNQINKFMIYGICNSIRTILPGCRLYHRGNRIYLLINLEIGSLTPADVRMKLSEQIRESLLKAALSDTFRELSAFPKYMQQAVACLDYMIENSMTDWFCEYRQIAISYWLRKGAGTLPADSLIAAGLQDLKRYDEENSTSLFKTLEAYLVNERSPVLTSKALHIHRSTLPHRLEKITELTGYNLNSPKTRLHLLMSFMYLKESPLL